MTIVRSSGTAPVASCWSARYCRKFSAASLSRSCLVTRRLIAASRLVSRISRTSFPIASPKGTVRSAASAFQNGIFPGCPGAGVTITLSCVISSMRQVDAPRTKVSPAEASKTISSSSSPTRADWFFSVPARKTPYRPRSGIVPPLVMAMRFEPRRAVTIFATRSHVRRGRNSANSSDG